MAFFRFDRKTSAAQSAGIELSHAAGGYSNSLFFLIGCCIMCRLVVLSNRNVGGSRRLVLENVDKIDDALVLYSIWWNWSIEPQKWARLYSADWNNNQRQERERLMKEKDRVAQLTSFDVLNFPLVKWSNGCLLWTCLEIERNTNKKEITHIFIILIHCGILIKRDYGTDAIHKYPISGNW